MLTYTVLHNNNCLYCLYIYLHNYYCNKIKKYINMYNSVYLHINCEMLIG